MNSHEKSSRLGFTLMELAIVLVIIGLIVGGIVAGREIIRRSELRASIAQITEYKTAISTFDDKFSGMPGDITNATTLWATAAGNGDGDRIIQWATEGYLAWNHLALSDLIPGNYTGTAVASQGVLDTNLPRMTYPRNTGVSLVSVLSAVLAPTVWWGNQSRSNAALFWGAVNAGGPTTAVGLAPDEASEVDRKMDDGLPDFGTVQSNNNSACTTAAASPAQYSAVNPTPLCLLVIRF